MDLSENIRDCSTPDPVPLRGILLTSDVKTGQIHIRKPNLQI